MKSGYVNHRYSSIAESVDDFTKQVEVMLVRTGAATDSEIVSVTPKKTEGGAIDVDVIVNSFNTMIAVTKAVEQKHLSVYIDGKGYIGVIPDSVQVTKIPMTTKVAAPPTEPTASTPSTSTKAPITDEFHSTQHPSVDNGFIWLSEYTSDIDNLNDCSTGSEWSGIVISRTPVGCYRFTHALTKQDEYNFLAVSNGNVDSLGMVCDSLCKSCISHSDNLGYNSCQPTWGGSILTTSSGEFPCIGGSELDWIDGGISVFRYSESGCDMKSNPAQKLYIRNYPAFDTNPNGTCTRDGSSGLYYKLSRTQDNNADTFFDGVYGCSDSDCSENCLKVDMWEEGKCYEDNEGKGIAFWESEKKLSECAEISEESNQDTNSNDADAKVAIADIADYEEETEQPASEEASTAEDSETTIESTTSQEASAVSTTSETEETTSLLNEQDEAIKSHTEVKHSSKQMASIVIAAGGVMIVAFLIGGVLHTRRRHLQDIDDESYDDDIYDEYDYNGYSKYNDWDDDRLVTDI